MDEYVKPREQLETELNELQQKYDCLEARNYKDITDLRCKEQTMTLLTHAVKSISECVSITDTDDKIIFVNSAFLKTYQYEAHELLGNSITIVRSPNNLPELTDEILPATLQGGWKGELLNRRKNGSEFPVYISTSYIKDDHGEIIALVGITTDITETKRYELESQVIYDLTQSVAVTDNLEELLQYIHQSLKKVLYAENCFVAIQNKDTGLFSFPYFVDQFDTTPEPLEMGKSCTAFVFRTGKPLLLTPEVFKRLEGQGEVEMVGLPSPSWIGVPLKTPSRTIGVLVIQHYDQENIYTEHDIQMLNSVGSHIASAIKRRQTEIELREKENLMQSVTNSAQDAILMMDPTGLVSYWNPAAERILGYTDAEAIGQNLHDLIVPARYHPAHHAAFPMFQITGQGNAMGKTLNLEARKKDGTEIHVQLSLSSVQIKGRWHSIGIIRDVTEQAENQLILIKAKQEAEKANKFKSQFLANMSHEIRTPLNAIIGFSQLMNRDKLLSDIQKEYNTSIISAGEHLLALINDILELSKIEAGRVVLNPSHIDLHAFLDDIQMFFKERTKSKNLQFLFEKSIDLPLYVLVDENKLRQIFVNLIGNALKFTDEGGIAVRSRVDKINDDLSMLVVEIQDSGSGIAADEMDKLFQNFEQTSSGINQGSGTGLGLALSRELAVLMGGTITVTSELGKGSVFTFQVQLQEGNPEAVEKIIAKRVIGIENTGQTYRILVVDDKSDNLKVATTLLRLVGFETCEAWNGEEAIAKFHEWNPHLILMDMRMPVMDGYESTRRIKSTEKGILTPVVALTASTFENELKKIERLGMQGYIRKPFREDELFNTIGKILDIKYIYDNEIPSTSPKLIDTEVTAADIIQLPNSFLLKMQNALDVADLDLMVILIKSIEPDHPELAKILLNLAQNYNYDQLQLLIQLKEKMR